MKGEERSRWCFVLSLANGSVVVVTVEGVHGRCCSDHWIALRGLHHSIQYQRVLGREEKKHFSC